MKFFYRYKIPQCKRSATKCVTQRFGDGIQILQDLIGQVTQIKCFSFRSVSLHHVSLMAETEALLKAAVLMAQSSASRMVCLVYCTQTIFVAWTETVESGMPGPE